MKKKPVVLVVMDGIGIREDSWGNAVKQAFTPTLDYLKENCPSTSLKASGIAVGLPSDDDMGNSEVGHNALGCGQVYSQGAKLVNESLADGSIYQSATWKELISNAQGHCLHFIGLLSDGNVHSHINHLLAMIRQAKAEGLRKVRIHCLLDGRDVPETSALEYVDILEAVIKEVNDENFDCQIASGGGRMVITMDRYEANWQMVEAGWLIHVYGQGRQFSSCTEAITTYRQELGVSDQELPGFVIAKDGEPVGKITDGDSVILFNFRGDRALEISRAFDEEDFTVFDRGNKPKVTYAGMLQYDGDLKIPQRFLVSPPFIQNTLTEYLCNYGIREYAISETQKFGHMTYFWNGNRSEPFSSELECWEEIKSDTCAFTQRPWMKSAQITDRLIEALKSDKYDFLRLNFPNGDMVGHTGDYQATLIAVEAVDLALGRIKAAVDEVGAILIVTADHGNAEEMYEKSKDHNLVPAAKTAHSLNPVPFIIYGSEVEITEGEYGLANVAATVLDLLELPENPHWLKSIIK